MLPILVDGTGALLGPLYFPNQSVCPGCLEYWLSLSLYDRTETPAPGMQLAAAVADAVVALSEEFAGDGRVNGLEAGALYVNASGGKPQRHPVFPRRDCLQCAAIPMSPRATLRVHCSPYTGIVNRMQVSDAPVAGAYRATATWASPLPVPGARPCLKRQDSYGRGRSRSEAESGCIGEALERYSLIYRGNEAMVRARFSELDAIHPAHILLFSEAQYTSRHEWNATADEEFQVLEPFQPDVNVDWIEAKALHADGSKFVPAACCLMWYEFRTGEPEFARADTVGCGGGPTFDEALTHALLEWVERDAMAIWWENRLRRPAVRLESFDSRELEDVVGGLRSIGRDLFLLDCTTDIGIPAYVSVAPRFDGSELLFAGAAHPSPRQAAYRAASEVGQVWFEAKRSGALPDTMAPWLLRESCATQPYLVPLGFVDAPPEPAGKELAVADLIIDRLLAVGLEAYAVDQSRADVVSYAVRAIVPGLRHIWNRRAQGRLYDVPVKMGWLAEPIPEEELNPIRCMI